MRPRRCASALVRVVIVIAVVALLIGLTLPLVNLARHNAARTKCVNNLKLIGLAMYSYHDVFRHFPPGTAPDTKLPPDERLSLLVSLLPSIGEPEYSARLDRASQWDSPTNTAVFRGYVNTLYECPEYVAEQWKPTPEQPTMPTDHRAFTNYVGVAGLGLDAATLPTDDPRIGAFGYDRTLKMTQVKDGLATTAMILETGHDLGPWVRGGPSTVRGIDPADEPHTGFGRPFGGMHTANSYSFRRQTPSGSNVLLADASVRYVQDAVDPAVIRALATVAGGEPLPADW